MPPDPPNLTAIEALAERGMGEFADDWRWDLAAAVPALVARVRKLEAGLHEIDHFTYGWTLDTASTVIDRIRMTARALEPFSPQVPHPDAP